MQISEVETLSKPEMDMYEYLLKRFEESKKDYVIVPTSILSGYALNHLEQNGKYNITCPPNQNELLDHVTYLIIKLLNLRCIMEYPESVREEMLAESFEITPAVTEVRFTDEFMNHKEQMIENMKNRYLNKARQFYILRQ